MKSLKCCPILGVLAIVLASLAYAPASWAQGGPIVYVDGKATGPTHDGTSWNYAFTSLQEGINAALRMAPAQVWVGTGTYAETITLAPGVSVYGGFYGNYVPLGYETSLLQRDPAMRIAYIDGSNARRCVIGANDALLDGFTIRRGRAQVGAGLYNNHASPSILQCVFANNGAWESGGAIQNEFSSPLISGCKFSYNSATTLGGAINNSASSPRIERCLFSANDALAGGAIRNASASRPVVVNCVFDGNSASLAAAAIIDFSASASVISNCTFVRNSATGFGGCIGSIDGNPTITSCILWDGMKNEFFSPGPVTTAVNYSVNYTVNYSCIQNGYGAGTGNINVVPRFVDLVNGDLHLTNSSPCIDIGGSTASTPLGGITTDYDGNARGNYTKSGEDGKTLGDGSYYDMGAFENTNIAHSIVTFPDANLDATVRRALNKPFGSITPADCAGISTLALPRASIRSLAGLEFCVNLTALITVQNIYSGQGMYIEDLSPLAGMSSLQTLNLPNNEITDIAPLVDPDCGLMSISGSTVDLSNNPLSQLALCVQIPDLIGWGVTVYPSSGCMPDLDSDGLPDFYETGTSHTSTTNADSDGDGIPDGIEVLLQMNPLSSLDGRTDVDGDGLSTAREVMRSLNPLSTDTDEDLMPDKWEIDHDFDPLDPVDATGDADGDGYPNAQEYALGSDPGDPSDPNAAVFVSPTGVDSAGRGTRLLPYRTITYALSRFASTVLNPVSLTLLTGVYAENVTMEPGLRLSALPGEVVVIEGAVTGAAGSLLAGLELREPSVTAQDFVLLTVNNVSMRAQNVQFVGNSLRRGIGAKFLGSGPGGAIVSDSVFRSLKTGADVWGAIPTIRRTLFQNLSGDGIWIHALAAKDAGDGTLGDANDPNSGWLAFRDIDDFAVDNDRDTEVLVQHANWGTDVPGEIANQVSGDVDTSLPLPKSASLVPASIACAVMDASTKSAITNGTVTLTPGDYTPVTENTGGVYSLLCLSAGTYNVSVSASGYTTKSQSVTVAEGENKVITVNMSGGGGGGCGGSKALRTATAEKSLPSSIEDDPAATVASGDSVAMHLSAGAQVDPASVWARAEDGAALTAKWRASMEGDNSDGWIVTNLPASPKAEISITVGAKTLSGEDVGGYTRTFRLGQPKAAVSSSGVALDTQVPPLPAAYAEAVTPVYRFGAKTLSANPFTVSIPLPSGVKPRGLEVFYYSESDGQEGWYEGAKVKGWLATPRYAVVKTATGYSLRLTVNHGAVVQIGRATRPQAGSLLLPSLYAAGGLGLWLSFGGLYVLLSAGLGWIGRRKSAV